MKKIIIFNILTVFFSLSLLSCANKKSPDNFQKKNYQRTEYKKRSSLNFELINQELSPDFKKRRDVTQYIWLKKDFSGKELKSFLKRQYKWVKKQRIFKDGKRPENIFIAVYNTKKKASNGYSNWLASLEGTGSGSFNIVTKTNKRDNTEQTNGKIVCNKFEINYELNGNKLSVSLNTGLPDYTEIMVRISRSYWEEGNSSEYSINYLSEKGTVQEWKNVHTIVIDNSKWKNSLDKKQKELASIGLGFNVRKISNNIVVDMTVPINQSNPNFDENNSNLIGTEVETSYGLKIIEEEKSIYYPLNGSTVKKSKFANPLSLEVGVTYSISERTPLMPSFSSSNPWKSLKNIKRIPIGTLIKVTSIKQKSNTPWYEVEAFNKNGNQIGTGWINGQALMGQNIKIK